MHTTFRSFALIAAFAVLPALGCSLGLDFDRSKIGAGGDAGLDAGSDAATAKDAGGDAAMKDAAADATTPDAGVDAAVDAGKDAGDDSGGPECVNAGDCGADSACSFFQCVSGTCVENHRASGVLAVSGQVAGDCHRVECDGSGGLNNVVDDTDLPEDNKQCTTNLCTAGVPSHGAVTLHTPCTENGGSYCDGVDACVACNIDVHCGTSDMCGTYTCNTTTHACNAPVFAASGTPLSTGQTAGDCKQVQCNGAGGTMVATDGADNDDNNECTTDSCTGSTPVHTAVSDGISCTVGGSFCKGGLCAGCATAANCGTDTECQTFTCLSGGTCQTNNVADGTPLSAGSQTTGDCKQVQCNGSGSTKTVNFNSDLPADDGNQCTDDTCNAGTPTHPNVSNGTSCNQSGGSMCNDGTCGACSVDSDCGTDTECQTFTCLSGGTCQTNNVADGTPLSSGNQTTGDCKQLQCNGSGGTKTVDFNSDLPADDGNQCTTDTCSAGSPVHPAQNINTPCTQGGSFCNATSTCVQCNMDSQCSPAICIDNACIPNGTLTATSAAHTSPFAGDTNSVIITFTTAHKWAADGVLSLAFPNGYSLASATVASLTGVSGTYTTMTVGNELLITRTSGVTTAPGVISVQLDNVRNPQVSGNGGAITIETKTGAGVTIDSGNASGENFMPGEILSATVMLDAVTASTTVNVTVAGTGTNPWPADGSLDVVFPAGFDVSAAQLTGGTGADGTFTLSVNGQTLTIARNGDGTDTPGGAFTVDLTSIVTPATTGMTADYVLTSFTSADVVIDTGVAAGTDIQ